MSANTSKPLLPNVGQGVAIIQVLNDRSGVSNLNVDLNSGQDVLYSQQQGTSLPNMRCETGVANIDNVCVCPASSNSSPFVPYPSTYRADYMNTLFSSSIQQPMPTAAARHIAERSSQRIRQ